MATMLVTGGAGFIGYHLCRSLLEKEHRLIVIDQLHSYYDPALKQARVEGLRRYGNFSFYREDILDREAIDAIFRREEPETIIHLAAIPGVRGSLNDPLTYVDIDVKGTVQMLEAARQFGVKRFLFASSSSVYGERPLQKPLKEDDASLSVASPYAASKLAAEVYCRTYADLYGMAVTCLRFFTVYGPHQRPDMAISRFLERLLANRPLPLYDTRSVRDYTYVDDIVRGMEAALARMAGWQVYNLGGGRPVGLLELVRRLEEVTGKTADVEIVGAQPGDVSGTWADVSRARERLGWVPEVTLPEGLERFYRWWIER
jgi:UDP-glucuronate 4-epimerase